MTPSAVIASQRVGAKRRPRTGSAKQSMPPQKERMDCFVARAPRNDGRGCSETESRANAPHSHVIARLDRATQYSRGGRDQPRGRGVLDPPLSRRMTTCCRAGAVRSNVRSSETRGRWLWVPAFAGKTRENEADTR